MLPVDDLTTLALAAGNGDRAALEQFIRRAQPDVWRLCANLGRGGDTDDLTQETFIRAMRSLPSFRADSSARTWILTIARRVCADHVRSAQRQRRLIDRLAQTAEQTSVVSDGTSTTDALTMLSALGEEQRVAMVLTQVLGLSYAEAGEVCGCPVGTIRSRVARAREALTEGADSQRTVADG